MVDRYLGEHLVRMSGIEPRLDLDEDDFPIVLGDDVGLAIRTRPVALEHLPAS